MASNETWTRDEAVDFDELLADPAVRQAAEDAQGRSQLIESLVRTRKDSGVTQREVADAMHTSQSAVSDFENMSTDPYLSTVQRYARAVGGRLVIRVETQEAESAPRMPEERHVTHMPAKIMNSSFAMRFAAESKKTDYAKAA